MCGASRGHIWAVAGLKAGPTHLAKAYMMWDLNHAQTKAVQGGLTLVWINLMNTKLNASSIMLHCYRIKS